MEEGISQAKSSTGHRKRLLLCGVKDELGIQVACVQD